MHRFSLRRLALPLGIVSLAAAAHAQPTPRIVATLVPNGSYRIQGTLSLEKGRKDGETRARVALLNAPANAQLGWTIRKGQCGENGTEMGSVAAYRALPTRSDGSVELTANLPMALPTGDAYHVDILEERGSSTILACGGLAEDTGK
jgi:hypothetical protein